MFLSKPPQIGVSEPLWGTIEEIRLWMGKAEESKKHCELLGCAATIDCTGKLQRLAMPTWLCSNAHYFSCPKGSIQPGFVMEIV